MSETESEIKFIGRIYKITSPNTEKVYVGSTTQTLNRRFQHHKSEYKTYIDGKTTTHMRSFDIIENGEAKITLIYEGIFCTKAELFRLEGEIMQRTKNCCNKTIAGRTQQEYDIKYRLNNIDKIRDRNNKQYVCRICKSNFTHSNKSRHIKTAKHISASSSSSSSSSSSWST